MTQKEAFEILKMGHNVFLTGAAGSGKTYLLNQYVSHLKKHNAEVAITASTGIAATHLNGITLHSWSGIGINDNLTEKDLKIIAEKKDIYKRVSKTKVLIIDEVSMLHSFRLDFVDKICKLAKQNLRPFGEIQIILCGDFFQLPPVTRAPFKKEEEVNRSSFLRNNETNENSEENNFAYKSEIWQNMNLKVCYLDNQFRHIDNELIKILNDIRNNNVGENTLIPLRKRYNQEVKISVNPTKLYAHNIDADGINQNELAKISGLPRVYITQTSGAKPLIKSLIRSCLAPQKLELKISAPVIFVKNNLEGKYVNGTLGKIIGFNSDNMPVVETAAGKKIYVEPAEWKIEENGKVKAKIIQIPLRLAWAITIHKSQGMSLDAAHIDLSKSFTPGMGYVALSRVRSLNGLKLLGLNRTALKVSDEILEFDKRLKKISETTALELKNISPQEILKKQKYFLETISSSSQKEKNETSTYYKTKELILQKFGIKEIAVSRKMTEETIINHLEKIIENEKSYELIKYLRPVGIRFEKIKNAFEKSGDTRLAPVKEILGCDFSYNEIRLAKLFLL